MIAARTRHGEAVHATDPARPGVTLCGRRIWDTDAGLARITADGIQHPWRCEICSKKAAAR